MALSSDSYSWRHAWVRYCSLILLLLGAVAVFWLLWRDFPILGEGRIGASNVGFILLINVNIIAVMVLVFLVTKNLIRLVIDRRRNILGSRLRTKLVTAFVGLSLVPTVLLFMVAKGILETVLQEWLSPQVAVSVDGAVQIADLQQRLFKDELERIGDQISREIIDITSLSSLSERSAESVAAVQTVLNRWNYNPSLSSIVLLDAKGEIIVRVKGGREDEAIVGIGAAQNSSSTTQTFAATRGVFAERTKLGEELLKGVFPVVNKQSSSPPLILVLSKEIPVEMARLRSVVSTAAEDYRELKSYRRPLESTYLLTLVVVTLLIVFAAIWVGFHLARSLAVPIGLLGKATAQVAQGNLDCQLPDVGDDELSLLVRSFNTMTSDLKRTTDELVSRRRYMETVFTNLGVGIISVDTAGRIQAMNRAAYSMLGRHFTNSAEEQPVADVLPNELNLAVEGVLENLKDDAPQSIEGTVPVMVAEQMKYVQVTGTRLTDGSGVVLGAVILLDDITELRSAQRMAAWREVARRIAHEIKNPLTPIQLSAQRIQRRFSNYRDQQTAPLVGPADQALIEESTEMIVEQVETLRVLVNEFSQFARMPRAKPTLGDINSVIRETVAVFRNAHPGIEFSFELDEKLPEFLFDREQMGRVLLNIVDNAVASVEEAAKSSASSGKIALHSEYLADLGIAACAVTDNGVGVSEVDKQRIFEPYYSRKAGGTGLGLAIAQAIVNDHNGVIRVKENSPQGAVLIIELPII